MKISASIIILFIACNGHAKAQSRDTTIMIPLFTPNKAVDSLMSKIQSVDSLKNANFVVRAVGDSYESLLQVEQIQTEQNKYKYNPANHWFTICGYIQLKNSVLFIEGNEKYINEFFVKGQQFKSFRFNIEDIHQFFPLGPHLYSELFVFKKGIFSYGAVPVN